MHGSGEVASWNPQRRKKAYQAVLSLEKNRERNMQRSFNLVLLTVSKQRKYIPDHIILIRSIFTSILIILLWSCNSTLYVQPKLYSLHKWSLSLVTWHCGGIDTPGSYLYQIQPWKHKQTWKNKIQKCLPMSKKGKKYLKKSTKFYRIQHVAASSIAKKGNSWFGFSN